MKSDVRDLRLAAVIDKGSREAVTEESEAWRERKELCTIIL